MTHGPRLINHIIISQWNTNPVSIIAERRARAFESVQVMLFGVGGFCYALRFLTGVTTIWTESHPAMGTRFRLDTLDGAWSFENF